MSNAIRLLVTGDVFPDIEDGRSAFRHLPPLFDPADIVFGNVEGVYSDRPALAPSRLVYGGAPPERGDMLGEVGFDVMGCATNHMVDGGYVALSDTLELLRGQGIVTTGAGVDIGEATRPVVVERGGVRVAFLSFCSVFPVGYEAREERPGIAPLRIQTFYANPFPNMWDPGVEPVITCVPLAEDMERVFASVATAREVADVVVIGLHWGYAAEVRSRLSPARVTHDRVWRDTVQDYEVQIAREVADRGADVVVCHHQATLRGVEVHGGTPIFYGLGNFAHHYGVDNPHKRGNRAAGHAVDSEFPYLPFKMNQPRNTGLAVIDVDDRGVLQAGFIPACILPDGSTEPLRPGDPRIAGAVAHLEGLNRDLGIATSLTVEDDEWATIAISTDVEHRRGWRARGAGSPR